MNDRYRLPKRRVPAAVRTRLGALHIVLFLAERAQTHAGLERPSDLLNDAPPFLPVEDENGGIVLLRRESVVTLTVATKDELPDESVAVEELAGELQTATRIALVLEDGQTLQGTVRYQLPEDRSRLQDFLNEGGLFFPLHHEEGDRVCLVNKRRISRVVLLE